MNRNRLLIASVLVAMIGSVLAPRARPFSGPVSQEPARQPAVESQKANPPKQMPQQVVKTYTLKHIRPEAILDVIGLYVDAKASHIGNVLTVKIWDYQVPKLEELLKKLDIEKKTVQFQVFAVVASRESGEERRPEAAKGQAAAVAQTATLKSSPGAKTIAAGEPSYKGEPISIKLKDTDIRDVVLYIANIARLNVVFDAEVRGTISCNIEDMPWDQALDLILKQAQMGRKIEGKTLQVAPLKIFGSEQGQRKAEALENRELKKVLDELKALWNFKAYDVDGPSFLTVLEDSGPNNFKLVTNRALNLILSNVRVQGDEPGQRVISIEQLKLTGMTNFAEYVFVDTRDLALKEKGYLVAGVSGYGSASSALILVLNAEIK
jgi:type II secretory pathway component GspD/PulD (secretin)